MVRRAGELPINMTPDQKEKLLGPMAARLAADATEAEKLSREAPQDAQPALKRMADAAREGEKLLRAVYDRGGK